MADLVFIRKWIDALRSGEFKQATDGLATQGRNDERIGYCCLGVACNIHPDAVLLGPGSGEFELGFSFIYKDISEDNALAPELMSEETGVQSHLPGFFDPEFSFVPEKDNGESPNSSDLHLARANDSWRFTFSQIADCVEWYYFGNED